MTREDAGALGTAIKAMLADAGWVGFVVAIGLDDDGVTDPAAAAGWYVRVDRMREDGEGERA